MSATTGPAAVAPPGGPSGNTNPSAFDTSMIALTAQMSKEMKERNARRAERRKDADDPAEVSEDEDEQELTDRMNSLRRTHQQNLLASTASKNQPKEPETGFKFADAKAIANGGYRAVDSSFPEDIFVLARNGVSPPLTMFTSTALTDIRLGRDVTYRKFARGATSTNIRVLDTTAFPNEKDMSLAQWLAAYENFLNIISELCEGVKIFEGFVKHHQRAVTDPDIEATFEAHKEFDCDHVRPQFFTRGGIMIDVNEKDYLEGWNRVVQRVAKRATSQEIQTTVAQYIPTLDHDGKSMKTKNHPRYQPYDKSRNSFRKDSPTSERVHVDYLCLRCGNKGHKADTCNQIAPSKPGRSFIVAWRGKYLYRTSDNQPVCLRHNVQGPGKCTMPLTTPSTYVPCVLRRVMVPPRVLAIEGEKVVTPYRAEAWRITLERCGLQQKYPNLVHDLIYGSPIGFPPPLLSNSIPHNSSSASDHADIVDKYIADEIDAGRMFGGLSVEDAEVFFRGHFRTAPMAVIDEGTKYRVVHNLSAKDKNGNSTNSWLNVQEKPTKWYTAAMFADAVSVIITNVWDWQFCMSWSYSPAAIPRPSAVAIPDTTYCRGELFFSWLRCSN